MRIIAWSMRALQKNELPSKNVDGKPLTGWRAEVAGKQIGLPGQFASFGVDWEAFCDVFGWARWNSNEGVTGMLTHFMMTMVCRVATCMSMVVEI